MRPEITKSALDISVSTQQNFDSGMLKEFVSFYRRLQSFKELFCWAEIERYSSKERKKT